MGRLGVSAREQAALRLLKRLKPPLPQQPLFPHSPPRPNAGPSVESGAVDRSPPIEHQNQRDAST
jgi:hypothetical protein